MSKLTYLHKVLNQHLKDGEVTTHEEVIMDGPKGITVKLYTKDSNGIQKISITGKDDKFVMKTINGDKKDEKHMNKDELIKELTKNKNLKFALDFAKSQKGGKQWLNDTKKESMAYGSKKGSKKSTKKGSKKGSRKGSKKNSKKGSRKVSKMKL
jgi:hypothetical protein